MPPCRVQPRCCHHDHESPVTHTTENDQRRPASTTFPHDALRHRLPDDPPKGAPGLPRPRDATRDARLVLPLPEVLRGDRPGSRPENVSGARSLHRCCHRICSLLLDGQSLRAGATDHSGLAENQRSPPKQRPPETAILTEVKTTTGLHGLAGKPSKPTPVDPAPRRENEEAVCCSG
jgi:hypothetical protein